MKKVFSLERFKAIFRELGKTEGAINYYVNAWAGRCEGLTEEEMFDIGILTKSTWMVEVEDEEPTKPQTIEERILDLQKRGYYLQIACIPGYGKVKYHLSIGDFRGNDLFFNGSDGKFPSLMDFSSLSELVTFAENRIAAWEAENEVQK